jgi:hypothetical protein
MSELTRLGAVAVFGAATLAAFFVVLAALFPDRMARTRAAAGRAPGRSFFIGLVNAIFFLVLILALQAIAEATGIQLFAIPALLLLTLLGIAALFGLGGMAQLVGERLLPERGHYFRIAAGAVVIGLGCALPFVGWFGLLPYVAVLGLGAFGLSFFEPAKQP